MEKEIAQGNDLPDLLIGSDTVVVLDGTLLEKPQVISPGIVHTLISLNFYYYL